jgi:hypothetical protein
VSLFVAGSVIVRTDLIPDVRSTRAFTASRSRRMLVGMRLTAAVTAFVLIVPLVACTTSSAGDGGIAGNAAAEISCDPLAAKPIALGVVVGVGKDASGTLYVDAASGVWVSERGTLVRQHVTGTGQSGTNEFNFTFEG